MRSEPGRNPVVARAGPGAVLAEAVGAVLAPCRRSRWWGGSRFRAVHALVVGIEVGIRPARGRTVLRRGQDRRGRDVVRGCGWRGRRRRIHRARRCGNGRRRHRGGCRSSRCGSGCLRRDVGGRSGCHAARRGRGVEQPPNKSANDPATVTLANTSVRKLCDMSSLLGTPGRSTNVAMPGVPASSTWATARYQRKAAPENVSEAASW